MAVAEGLRHVGLRARCHHDAADIEFLAVGQTHAEIADVSADDLDLRSQMDFDARPGELPLLLLKQLPGARVDTGDVV